MFPFPLVTEILSLEIPNFGFCSLARADNKTLIYLEGYPMLVLANILRRLPSTGSLTERRN